MMQLEQSMGKYSNNISQKRGGFLCYILPLAIAYFSSGCDYFSRDQRTVQPKKSETNTLEEKMGDNEDLLTVPGEVVEKEAGAILCRREDFGEVPERPNEDRGDLDLHREELINKMYEKGLISGEGAMCK